MGKSAHMRREWIFVVAGDGVGRECDQKRRTCARLFAESWGGFERVSKDESRGVVVQDSSEVLQKS